MLVTLLEAVGLVVLVVVLFLQNWRSSLIPLVAVPVSLVGTLAVMLLLGYTLNTLSLFGLVLAIGFALAGLGRGILRHGFMLPGAIGGLGVGVMAGALTLPHSGDEVLYTLIGVGLVALGHDLNRRALV